VLSGPNLKLGVRVKPAARGGAVSDQVRARLGDAEEAREIKEVHFKRIYKAERRMSSTSEGGGEPPQEIHVRTSEKNWGP